VIDYIGEYGEEAATVPKVGQRIGRMACSEFIARVLKKEERPLFEARVKQIGSKTKPSWPLSASLGRQMFHAPAESLRKASCGVLNA
jgi:hypothetical protein